MLLTLNWITIFVSLIPLTKSVKRVTSGKYSLIHISIFAFWLMQILPLLVEIVVGENINFKSFPTMYRAMTDDNVGLIYDGMVIGIIFLLYFFAEKLCQKHERKPSVLISLMNMSINMGGKILLFVGMFVLPIFVVLLAPNSLVYLKFAYFYTETSYDLSERLFHTDVMVYVGYIAFGCTMLQYLYRSESKISKNMDILTAIILFTWLDQKRALLTFSLIGIIAIDIIKHGYKSKNQLIFKSVLFGAITVTYFVIYSQVTGKGSESQFYFQYVLYYSRMNCIKTSIYDLLNGHTMLEYNGQTILYNIFFFVPRQYWIDKPVMFCKYFTAYAYGRNSLDFMPWNLHVNIWTEFLENFGFIGIPIAIAFIVVVANITEKTENVIVFLFGTVFIVFYCMFGFETLTLISYVLWLGGLLINKQYGLINSESKNLSRNRMN